VNTCCMPVTVVGKLYIASQLAIASLQAAACSLIEDKKILPVIHGKILPPLLTNQTAVDFRVTDRDLVIGGYRVPKNTPVQLPPYPMHLSSTNFAQPLKFWPERWAQQMPVGSQDKGMLLCLGYSFVQVENLPIQ